MRILLITTLPNKVAEILLTQKNLETHVLNISSKKEVFGQINEYILLNRNDILITYRCPYLIPYDIFNKFQLAINIHPLELPRFSGLNPWEAVVQSGITGSKITVHHLSEQVDSGSKVATRDYTFPSPFTIESSRERADTEASILIRMLSETLLHA